MSNIEINECVYKVHPVYDLYAANEAGEVINIVKKDPMKGNMTKSGYMHCMVRKHTQKGQKTMFVHRFVYECFNGLIPKDEVIDHINNEKTDNRLCNLQLMTQQENCKKSAVARDYTFVAKNHVNKKCVKATNCTTNEITYFNSMYCCAQYLDINVGIVKMVCENINRCKSGVSKKDGCSYKFEYVKKEDMPDDYKKSANIRPKRVSENDDKKSKNTRQHRFSEEKKKRFKEAVNRWQQKEYRCPRCDKVMKNNCRYAHNKRCK